MAAESEDQNISYQSPPLGTFLSNFHLTFTLATHLPNTNLHYLPVTQL
jgi:hypothetical protein